MISMSERNGIKVDGVFVMVCTTLKKELVLIALVLKVGLQR